MPSLQTTWREYAEDDVPQDTKYDWSLSDDFDITLNALADGSMRQSENIGPNYRGEPYLVSYKIRVGASPDSNGRIEFHFGKYVTGVPDGGIGTADAAYSGSKGELYFVGAQWTDGTANAWYEGSFYLPDEFRQRPPIMIIVVVNETGDALYADDNHVMSRLASFREIIV